MFLCYRNLNLNPLLLSSVNKDFYRESVESIPLSVQSMGSTEYIVLPNHGKGIGIGISGKSGVIIRNILQDSIADKVSLYRQSDLDLSNVNFTEFRYLLEFQQIILSD